jgi:hypothetical protein
MSATAAGNDVEHRSRSLSGHQDLPAGGHEISAVATTASVQRAGVCCDPVRPPGAEVDRRTMVAPRVAGRLIPGMWAGGTCARDRPLSGGRWTVLSGRVRSHSAERGVGHAPSSAGV